MVWTGSGSREHEGPCGVPDERLVASVSVEQFGEERIVSTAEHDSAERPYFECGGGGDGVRRCVRVFRYEDG